jgi:hypothetical protein
MNAFFKMIDYAASCFMGVGTLFLVSLIIGKGGHMVFAMIVGMIIGMAMMVLTALIFTGLSTFFHILPGGMIITMTIGMVAGMMLSSGLVSGKNTYMAAAVFSCLIQAIIDIYNLKLKGEAAIDGRR